MAQKGGRQGRGATYGHPGRDIEGQRRRAASAAPASGEPRSGSWLTAGPGGAGPSGAERSEAAGARRGSGSLPRPHAGGFWSRRRGQETRQPSSALRLLPSAEPVICARPLSRLANSPKPRAAPGPPRGCNLRPRPRSPPGPSQSPHLPGQDPPLR